MNKDLLPNSPEDTSQQHAEASEIFERITKTDPQEQFANFFGRFIRILLINLVVAGLLMLVIGITFATETKQIIGCISDGFFISGGLFVGMGIMVFSSSQGLFNGIAFEFRRSKNNPLVKESYYDYVTKQEEKSKKKGKSSTALTFALSGALNIGIALVFLVVYSYLG